MTTPEIQYLLSLIPGNALEHAILLMSPEGQIIWANEGAQQVIGDTGQLINHHLAAIFTAEDIAAEIPALELATAKSHRAAEDDRWHIRQNGAKFWASGTMYALRDENGALRGFAKLFRDRTDLKGELDYFHARLRELERSKANLTKAIGVIAHELRSPLGVLSNISQMLRRGVSDPDKNTELLDKQLALITRLIEDLSDATRVSTGQVQLAKRPHDLRAIVQGAVHAVTPELNKREHHLSSLFPAAPLRVCVDAERIHQVFVNLLTNAIKYTPTGGNIWVSGNSDEENAIAKVRDSGIGIEPQLMNSIFDLFTTGTRPSSTSLGIGLALVREYVTLHDGSVQVRSNGPSTGSEFTVRLPLLTTTSVG